MNAILEQLGLDRTFFIEMGIFLVLFLFLSKFYFRPFLALFEARYRKTIGDREKAEKLMRDAQTKMDDYKRTLSDARINARAEYDLALLEAKKLEALELSKAREEAKKITQQTVDQINHQRNELKKQLNQDVENLAQSISERLLSR